MASLLPTDENPFEDDDPTETPLHVKGLLPHSDYYGHGFKPLTIPALSMGVGGGHVPEPKAVTVNPKQVLHEGEATYSGYTLDSYKAKGGGAVDFYYNEKGEPETATYYVAGKTQKYFNKDEVEFPVKNQPKNSLVEAVKNYSDKPTLHYGEPVFVGSGYDMYLTKEGTPVYYDFDKNGNPKEANVYPSIEPGFTEPKKYTPDEINFPKKKPQDPADEPSPKSWDKVESSSTLSSPIPEWVKDALNDPFQIKRRFPHWSEKHHEPLTDDEKDVLRDYGDFGYESVNKLLSSKLGSWTSPEAIESASRKADVLDSALNKSILPDSITTLYRKFRSGDAWNHLSSLEPGDTFVHGPFASTTVERSNTEGATGRIKIVNIPPGSKGAIMGPLAKYEEEKEVLLPRGMTFRVLGWEGEDRRTMIVEPVPTIKVWHGSHAEFEPQFGRPFGKFNLNKFGTGEGNADFGYGLYGAEARKLGEKYARDIAAQHGKEKGFLYESSIKAHSDDFIDWFKGYKDQSETVKKGLEHLGVTAGDSDTGRDIWQKLKSQTSPETAAKFLAHSGIKGIKYLDSHSREQGYGTSNYAVFDDNLIDVIRKYEVNR